MDKGGKGVGRFTWLKAFDKVEIESAYSEGNGVIGSRFINFDIDNGIQAKENGGKPGNTRKTTVKLIGFKEEYRKCPRAFKRSQKIAQRILEHCLVYFIYDNAPKIFVEDDNDRIDLHQLYQEIESDIVKERFTIKKEQFEIAHVKLFNTHQQAHQIILCAQSREVNDISISKQLGTGAFYTEENKKFFYAAYISSPYLDKHVNSTRLSFNFMNDSTFFYSISKNDITEEVLSLVKSYLKDFIEDARVRKIEKVEEYVSKHNPTLRSVIHYCPEVLDDIEPNSTDEKIDSVLYKHKGKAEYKIKQRSAKLLKTQAKSIEEIMNESNQIEEELDMHQKDNLAGYLVMRKMIIDLLDKKISLNTDHKYENEDIIHDIVFPRKTTTDKLLYKHHNLWLIDERLTFHAFASSDMAFNKQSTSESKDRPDILIYADLDSHRIARSVAIIELKKPQRVGYDKDPIDQVFNYIDLIKTGKIIKVDGRPLQVSSETGYFGFAICDVNNETIQKKIKWLPFQPLYGGRGYAMYNGTNHTYIELVNFDMIVTDAQQRHIAFFEKLGLK